MLIGEAIEAEEATGEPVAEEAGKPIVICVDDDRTNLNALGRVLRARCTVFLASTGLEALELVQANLHDDTPPAAKLARLQELQAAIEANAQQQAVNAHRSDRPITSSVRMSQSALKSPGRW